MYTFYMSNKVTFLIKAFVTFITLMIQTFMHTCDMACQSIFIQKQFVTLVTLFFARIFNITLLNCICISYFFFNIGKTTGLVKALKLSTIENFKTHILLCFQILNGG